MAFAFKINCERYLERTMRDIVPQFGVPSGTHEGAVGYNEKIFLLSFLQMFFGFRSVIFKATVSSFS